MSLSPKTRQRNASGVVSRNNFDWDDFFRGAVDSSAGEACVAVPRVIREITECGDDAILLSQLIYWFRQGKDGKRRARVLCDEEFWVSKTAKQWKEDTGIPERRVRRCIARLKRQGFIGTELGGFGGRKTVRHRLHPEAIEQAIEFKNFKE